jgi:23S rRNA pseudouridine1911/1915/1917 synthase
VERRYLCLVVGALASERGLIDAPLGRSPRDATKRAVVADGLEARTFYEVDERFDLEVPPSEGTGSSHGSDDRARFSFVACRLETGRTHQIRAHLAAIGHPVVGDVDYGGAVDRPGALTALARPFLHAATLGFDHPVSGERLRFSSPLPPDLAHPLAGLRSGA